MMRQRDMIRIWSWMLLALFFAGCSEHSEEVTGKNAPTVRAGVGISMPRSIMGAPDTTSTRGTRQSAEIVQASSLASDFRGMDHLRMICFDELPDDNTPNIGGVLTLPYMPVASVKRPGESNYNIFKDVYVPIGTKYVLFYGKAIDKAHDNPLGSQSEKFRYGSIIDEGLVEGVFQDTNDLLFSPEAIVKNQLPYGGSPIGPRLVTLLNDLLNTEATDAAAPDNRWSTTENERLHNLYLEISSLRTGSSHLIERILGMLHAELSLVEEDDPAWPLAHLLHEKIDEACIVKPQPGSDDIILADQYQGFPEDLYLPQGAARLGFDGSQFTESMTTSYGSEELLSQYCFPASLWYRTRSPLVASDQVQAERYDSVSTWSGVITRIFDSSKQEVQATTQSIALINQIEYAVGRLETRVQMNAGKFYDATGHNVDVTNGFRLKGIIIGGQRPVGWDFKPARYGGWTYAAIYDNDYHGTTLIQAGETAGTNHTLCLETPQNEPINVVLELVNLGPSFIGADGIIPSGGTFYLLSEFDPRKSVDYQHGTMDRVFQQDYVTYATIHIQNGWPDTNGDGRPDRPSDADPDEQNEGLANATNGIPSLYSTDHTFEVGLSVDLNWKKGLSFETTF